MSSPSGYSDDIDSDGYFKPGTKIHDDYYGYKESGKVARRASDRYNDEAKTRDRSKDKDAKHKATPNKKGSKESGLLKHRTYYRDDHKALEGYAGDAGTKTEKHANDRDNFNRDHRRFWTHKKGGDSLKRHEDEARIQHNEAARHDKRRDVHAKYKDWSD